MNESCPTHMNESCPTHMNESCPTHMNESCPTHMNESSCTYDQAFNSAKWAASPSLRPWSPIPCALHWVSASSTSQSQVFFFSPVFFGTDSNVWQSFTCVTWLIYTCVTRLHVWHDAFICEWHDLFVCMTWLIHMCDMTHSYVWHVSFIYKETYVKTWYFFTNKKSDISLHIFLICKEMIFLYKKKRNDISLHLFHMWLFLSLFI